jgi:hypothetical protein
VRSGAEAGPVPVGEHTLTWVSLEILPEPAGLRIRVAATANLVTFGVQRDQVPGAESVAVVALIGLTSALAEVAEVSPSASRLIFVVSRHREGDIT